MKLLSRNESYTNSEAEMFSVIEDVQLAMEREKYICERALATVLFLAVKLEKPVFLEGETGVGKTEVAKVLAQALGGRLIRLQCSTKG